MKQKTIHTGTCELLFVEFPEGAKEIRVWLGGILYDTNASNIPELVPYPFEVELLCKADKVTDGVVKELVQYWPAYNDKFSNYEMPFFDYLLNTALESWNSLLIANDIHFENPVKHPKQMQAQPASIGWYRRQVELHEEAQQNVWDIKRTYIFKKIEQ